MVVRIGQKPISLVLEMWLLDDYIFFIMFPVAAMLFNHRSRRSGITPVSIEKMRARHSLYTEGNQDLK